MSVRSDIVVVGGGMVGAAFAAGVARAGFDVVVLDAAEPPHAPTGTPYSPRVVALARASETFLRGCGAWELLDAERCQPYEAMRVWDAAGAPFDDDALAFFARDLGEANLGHIVENDALAFAAYRAATSCQGLVWRSGTRVSDVTFGERAVRVSTEEGETFRAALVVAADGAASAMRDHLRVAVREGSYDQQAVVTHVKTAGSHENTAWQRFLSTGPLALLPLADGSTSIVWSTTPDHAKALLAYSDEAFCEQVAQASAGVLGAVTECAPRYSFALRWLHVSRYSGARFAVIGDAAHVVHPLAGLGANLGLQDAASLVAALKRAADAQRDIGDAPVLRPFARERRADNALMLEALSQINRLFAGDQFALSLMRRFGLRSVNRWGPLKRFFASRAMGLAGKSDVTASR